MEKYIVDIGAAERDFCYNLKRKMASKGYSKIKHFYDTVNPKLPEEMQYTYRYFLKLVDPEDSCFFSVTYMLFLARDIFECPLDDFFTHS